MRDEKKILEYEAKRKPILADLMLRISSISENDINQADIPNNLKVLLRKHKSNFDLMQSISVLEQNIVYTSGFVSDKIGELRLWYNEETYIDVDKGSVLIPTGFPLWKEENGVWYGTLFSKSIDKRIYYLPTQKILTKTEYMGLLRDWRNGLSTANTPMTVVEAINEETNTIEAKNTLQMYGVKIY